MVLISTSNLKVKRISQYVQENEMKDWKQCSKKRNLPGLMRRLKHFRSSEFQLQSKSTKWLTEVQSSSLRMFSSQSGWLWGLLALWTQLKRVKGRQVTEGERPIWYFIKHTLSTVHSPRLINLFHKYKRLLVFPAQWSVWSYWQCFRYAGSVQLQSLVLSEISFFPKKP